MAVVAERVSFRETGASVALDAIRGAAALLVMFDHCHNLFFLQFGEALRGSSHPHLLYLLYAFGSAGRQAVVIFFVLSGYLIGGSVFRALEQGRWSWKDYLTHRFVRLWLVLIPALVLCACWDIGRLAVGGAHGAGLLELARAQGVTWKLFLSNVFFLQGVRTTTFGSDRVLWSLAAEFWYYMLFPLGLLALRKTRLGVRFSYAAGFLAVAFFVNRPLIGLFPVWLYGVALARVRPPKAGRAMRWIGVAVYVPCLFFFVVTPWPWHVFKMDYALGLVTTVFLWIVLSATARMNQRTAVAKASRGLAGASYSLYLVHYPFLAFVTVLLGIEGRWAPTMGHLAAGAGLCAAALLYSFGVAACTEWHNDGVRRWVEGRLSGRTRVREAAAAGL